MAGQPNSSSHGNAFCCRRPLFVKKDRNSFSAVQTNSCDRNDVKKNYRTAYDDTSIPTATRKAFCFVKNEHLSILLKEQFACDSWEIALNNLVSCANGSPWKTWRKCNRFSFRERMIIMTTEHIVWKREDVLLSGQQDDSFMFEKRMFFTFYGKTLLTLPKPRNIFRSTRTVMCLDEGRLLFVKKVCILCIPKKDFAFLSKKQISLCVLRQGSFVQGNAPSVEFHFDIAIFVADGWRCAVFGERRKYMPIPALF